MKLGEQLVRCIGIYSLFIVVQLIPFIVLDSGYKTSRIVVTVVALCVWATISLKPSQISAYSSIFITLSSITINVLGYLSLLAFQSTHSQSIVGDQPQNSNYQSSQNGNCYQSSDDQTIEELSINLRYFFGLLNGINFLPGIHIIHRSISLTVSILLWTFQNGGTLSRLISVSFFAEIGLLVYQIYQIEKFINDKITDKNVGSELVGLSMLKQSISSHSQLIKSFGNKLGGILYSNSKQTSTPARRKWKIEDVLYERDQLYEIVKKFASFKMVIYTHDMKMKFITTSFKNFLGGQLSMMGMEDEETIQRIFQKISVSTQENLYDHIKKTMDQWFGEGQINTSFEMLCNRDRIYSLSNCSLNLEKYQLYISEIQFDMQPCVLILFNTQEDVSTFNQYKHKMINSISHDLKTPLNGMILLLDILKEQIKKNFFSTSESYQPSSIPPLPSSYAFKPGITETSESINIKNSLTSTCIFTKQRSSVNAGINNCLEPTFGKLDQSQISIPNTTKQGCQGGGESGIQNGANKKGDLQQQKTSDTVQLIEQKSHQLLNNTPENKISLQKYSVSVCFPEEKPTGIVQNAIKQAVSQDGEEVIFNQLDNHQQPIQNEQNMQQTSNQFLSHSTQYNLPSSNMMVAASQSNLLQPPQPQYRKSKKQLTYKLEPTMSISLIPLQEEEESDNDNQDDSQKESQTDEEWLVQSSIRAATHNHLYHNNFSSFVDKQQFFKFQSNASPSSSSLIKKEEYNELDLKLEQLRQDTLQFRKKSIPELKQQIPILSSNPLPDQSIHMLNSTNSKKSRNPISTYNSPDGRGILSENHPLIQDSRETNHFFSDQQNSTSKNQQQQTLLLTTLNDDNNNLLNQNDSQNLQAYSPDFGAPHQLTINQIIQHPLIKLQPSSLQGGDTKKINGIHLSHSHLDENFSIQENDDAHNFMKQGQISHNNHLSAISKELQQKINQQQYQKNDDIFDFSDKKLGLNSERVITNNEGLALPAIYHQYYSSPPSANLNSNLLQQRSDLFSQIKLQSNNQEGEAKDEAQNKNTYSSNSIINKHLQLDAFGLNAEINLNKNIYSNNNNHIQAKQTNQYACLSTENTYKNTFESSAVSSEQKVLKINGVSIQQQQQIELIQQQPNQSSSSNSTPNNLINQQLPKDSSYLNISSEHAQQKSSSNDTIPSNQTIKQNANVLTPKSAFAQFRSPEIIQRKEFTTTNQISIIEPFSKQPKDSTKFDLLQDKEQMFEIEEKSIEGDQQSPSQPNLEDNQIDQPKLLTEIQQKASTTSHISNKLIAKRPASQSFNKLYCHSNTAGTLSQSAIPFNYEVSQRSFTYAHNDNERRMNSRIRQKKIKETSYKANLSRNDSVPQSLQNIQKKNLSQSGLTNTTLRDIKILYQYICNIEKNGYLLESRINDLIDYSTLLNKNDLSLNCTQFDLMEILLEMKDIFELQAKKKNCKLIIPNVKLNLKNDKPRIKQILINIIGNAIKFTFEGFIRIIVQISENSSNLIQITVQDTGIGIPDNIKKNVLNFAAHIHQVKDDNRQGVGIGLEICSRLCSIIGPLDQEIQIESKVNIGSSFSFLIYLNHPLYIQERDLSSNHLRQKKKKKTMKINTQISIKSEMEHENDIQIPMFETKHSLLTKQPILTNIQEITTHQLDVADANTPNKQIESSTSILIKQGEILSEDNKETILIVDDVAFNLVALKNSLILIFPDINIIEAQNGKQAVEKVHQYNGKLDLVIMDINMPIMDGFQAMTIINQEIKDNILEYVPIIAHTAFDNNEDKQKCFQLGAKGFLPKPAKKIELEKSVRPFLSSYLSD